VGVDSILLEETRSEFETLLQAFLLFFIAAFGNAGRTGECTFLHCTEAQRLAERLHLHVERQGLPAVEIIGPTPSYVQRVRSQYRWHILLRAPDPASVLRPLLPLPQGWRVDIDPVTLL
jgi:hypothetical protein